ncbi:MAG: hypothetical protein P8M34_03350 [Saprospiraceae bacterium]|nr:hypothetical protein [Saprospiraceae bacterium]
MWDGKKFRLNTRRNKTFSSLQMLWAYGNSIAELQKVVKKALPKWNSVYDLLQGGYGFDSPSQLFKTIGLYDMTQKTSYNYFKEQGIGEKIVYEFVDCISRVNYHQDGNINAFTDIVSLAGAGLDGGELFSVEGGNDLMIKNALSSQNINLQLESEVTSIQKLSEPNKTGHIIKTNIGTSDTFEIVVIACPLDLTNIHLPQYSVKRDRAYQTVHANFIAGHINYKYFNDVGNQPQTIFTIEDDSIPFVSIAKTGYAPDWDLPIYKVFSRNPLSEEFVQSVFRNINGQVHQEWEAYTVLSPMKQWPSFRLGNGLYYINAMESAVSAMETEAVAARNVMNLSIAQLRNIRK